jgi:hypothetical protein
MEAKQGICIQFYDCIYERKFGMTREYKHIYMYEMSFSVFRSVSMVTTTENL